MGAAPVCACPLLREGGRCPLAGKSMGDTVRKDWYFLRRKLPD